MQPVNSRTNARSAIAMGSGLLLVMMLAPGCGNAPRNVREMDRSAIALEASYPGWSSEHPKAQVVLVLRNLGTEPYRLVLPCALHGNDPRLPSADRPVLGVVAREPQSGNEESFILTKMGTAKSSRGKTTTLRPGRSIRLRYDLGSFYRWGPCGPDQWGDIVRYLQPGDRQIALRSVIWYSDDEALGEQSIQSAPVVRESTFPEWLFRKRGAQEGRDGGP